MGNTLQTLLAYGRYQSFFCVAGLTLKDESIRNSWEFIKRKTYSLWIKIIIIGLLAVFMHNALIKIGFYELDTYYAGKLMISYGYFDF